MAGTSGVSVEMGVVNKVWVAAITGRGAVKAGDSVAVAIWVVCFVAGVRKGASIVHSPNNSAENAMMQRDLFSTLLSFFGADLLAIEGVPL